MRQLILDTFVSRVYYVLFSSSHAFLLLIRGNPEPDNPRPEYGTLVGTLVAELNTSSVGQAVVIGLTRKKTSRKW